MGSEIVFLEIRDETSQDGATDGSGNADIEVEGPQGDSLWLVERHVIYGLTHGDVICYVGAATASKVRDAGNLWVAKTLVGDQSSPIRVPPGASIFYAIRGGDADKPVTVNVQYRLQSNVAGQG